MRIGSAFLKARDNKEDRIQKRRSDNMAAFNNYVKTQAELGVDASVQDLETMKRNLAGGDFYYGKQLPSSNVIEETSARLGAIQADKDANMASTRLSNQNQMLVNMETSLKGFVGADFDKIKNQASFKPVIDFYGESQARTYLGLLTSQAVSAYIQTRNLSQYKTTAGIEAAISAAPPEFQSQVQSFLEGNRQTFIQLAEETAEKNLVDNYETVFEGIRTEDKAAEAAVRHIERTLPSEVDMTPDFKRRIQDAAKTDFARLRRRQMETVAGEAAGMAVDPAFANQPLEIDRLVRKLAARVYDEDDKREEAESFRERLRNDLTANATNALTASETEQIRAIKVSIGEITQAQAQELVVGTDAFNDYVDLLIEQSEINLEGSRWVVNGQKTPAYELLVRQIASSLGVAVSNANRIELATDLDKYNKDLNAYLSEDGKTPSRIQQLINASYDFDNKVKLLGEVNAIRAKYNFPALTEKDAEWKSLWETFSDRIGMAQATRYQQLIGKLTTEAKTLAGEAQDAARTRLALYADALGENAKERADYKAMSLLVNKYFIKADQVPTVFEETIRAFENSSEDLNALNEENAPEFERIMSNIATRLGLQRLNTGLLDYQTEYIEDGLDGLIKPGTSVAQWGKSTIDGALRRSNPHYGALIALDRDAPQAKVTEARNKLDQHIDVLQDLHDNVLEAELKSPYLQEILQGGTNHSAALTALKNTISNQIKIYKAAKPEGMYSFLNHIPNTKNYRVNENMRDTAKAAGFEVGALYVLDKTSSTGFRVDRSATAAADPTGAAAPSLIDVEAFAPTQVSNIQVDLSNVNTGVAEQFQRAYNGFSPSVDPAGEQRRILNYMLKNEKVMAYFQSNTRATAKERAAMLQDPLAWFENVKDEGTQIDDPSLMGPRFNKADIAEKEIENIYDSFFSSMDLPE